MYRFPPNQLQSHESENFGIDERQVLVFIGYAIIPSHLQPFHLWNSSLPHRYCTLPEVFSSHFC